MINLIENLLKQNNEDKIVSSWVLGFGSYKPQGQGAGLRTGSVRFENENMERTDR